MSRCEVQSPGFTSRLTNIVRARQENPQYSRVGNLPLVRLSKYVDGYYRASSTYLDSMLMVITGQALIYTQPTLRHSPPRLHSKGRGRSPVTLRIAPSEPYSPFKRFSSSSERSNAMRRGEEMGMRDGNSTDPR